VTPAVEGLLTPNSPEVELERRRALRALLRNPLLLAAGDMAEEYLLVRRHSAWLKHWLGKFPAWSLHVDKEFARLRKVPPDLFDETRPAVDRTSGTTFSRRRYALCCLALGALERSDRETTMGKIAKTITEFVATSKDSSREAIFFDIGNYDQRRDLVHALRLLMDLGVLRRVEGDELHFLNRTGSSNVLYEINRPVLAAMLNVAHSAFAGQRTSGDESVAQRVSRLIEDRNPTGQDAHGQHIRSRLMRILLDDPVLYFHELNDEEREFLEQHRSYLLAQISEATGLLPEIRREGIAMVDDQGDLSDIRLPEDSTDGQVSVLVVEWLAEFARHHAGEAISPSKIEEYIRNLIRVHGSRWRQEIRDPGAESRLTQEILLRLRSLHLIQRTSSGVVPLAACGRYAGRNSLKRPVAEE